MDAFWIIQVANTHVHADDGLSIPSASSGPSSSNTTGDVPIARDDWWYKGADNLLLNRSGEHRTFNLVWGLMLY